MFQDVCTLWRWIGEILPGEPAVCLGALRLRTKPPNFPVLNSVLKVQYISTSVFVDPLYDWRLALTRSSISSCCYASL